MIKTMSSLEGKKLRKTTSSRDILGKITRPAPLPPTYTIPSTSTSDPADVGVSADSRPVSGTGIEARRASMMSKVEEAEEKCVSLPSHSIIKGRSPLIIQLSNLVLLQVTLKPS